MQEKLICHKNICSVHFIYHCIPQKIYFDVIVLVFLLNINWNSKKMLEFDIRKLFLCNKCTYILLKTIFFKSTFTLCKLLQSIFNSTIHNYNVCHINTSKKIIYCCLIKARKTFILLKIKALFQFTTFDRMLRKFKSDRFPLWKKNWVDLLSITIDKISGILKNGYCILFWIHF